MKSATFRSARPRFVIVAVVAMVAIQMFAITVSGISARDGALDSAERTIRLESQIATTRIQRFLDPPERLIDDTVGLLDRDILSEDAPDLEIYLSTRLSSLDHVAGAYVGYPDGSFVSVAATTDGVGSFTSTRLDGVTGIEVRTLHDETFDPTESTTAESTYDPGERPWYTGAIESDTLVWSEPTLFFGTTSPGIFASRALRDDAGDVRAVVGVAVQLSGLSSFLDDLDLGHGADAFLVADGEVIGFPNSMRVEYQAVDGELTLPTPDSFDIAAAADTAADDVIHLDGGELVYRRTFQVTNGVEWDLILQAPESGFTDVADRQQSTVLWVTIGGGVVVVLSLLLLLRVTRPIVALEEQAATDPLTGLSNRRHISSIGQTMLRQLRRGECLAVLTLDLDHFKELNDRHGHHIGDHALVVVAEQLNALTRRGDMVGRLGGDEFVVAIPVDSVPTGIDLTTRILTRLTDAISSALPQCELGVTGGMTVSDDVIVDFDELLIEADAALLQAKTEAKGMMFVADRVVAERLRS